MVVDGGTNYQQCLLLYRPVPRPETKVRKTESGSDVFPGTPVTGSHSYYFTIGAQCICSFQ